MLHEDVLIEPIVSEKSWGGQDGGKYTFKVHPDANKLAIRKAVENIFKVRVERVWTMRMIGKPKKVRFYQSGKRADWKKAVVQVAEGQRIEIYQG